MRSTDIFEEEIIPRDIALDEELSSAYRIPVTSSMARKYNIARQGLSGELSGSQQRQAILEREFAENQRLAQERELLGEGEFVRSQRALGSQGQLSRSGSRRRLSEGKSLSAKQRSLLERELLASPKKVSYRGSSLKDLSRFGRIDRSPGRLLDRPRLNRSPGRLENLERESLLSRKQGSPLSRRSLGARASLGEGLRAGTALGAGASLGALRSSRLRALSPQRSIRQSIAEQQLLGGQELEGEFEEEALLGRAGYSGLQKGQYGGFENVDTRCYLDGRFFDIYIDNNLAKLSLGKAHINIYEGNGVNEEEFDSFTSSENVEFFRLKIKVHKNNLIYCHSTILERYNGRIYWFDPARTVGDEDRMQPYLKYNSQIKTILETNFGKPILDVDHNIEYEIGEGCPSYTGYCVAYCIKYIEGRLMNLAGREIDFSNIKSFADYIKARYSNQLRVDEEPEVEFGPFDGSGVLPGAVVGGVAGGLLLGGVGGVALGALGGGLVGGALSSGNPGHHYYGNPGHYSSNPHGIQQGVNCGQQSCAISERKICPRKIIYQPPCKIERKELIRTPPIARKQRCSKDVACLAPHIEKHIEYKPVVKKCIGYHPILKKQYYDQTYYTPGPSFVKTTIQPDPVCPSGRVSYGGC